MRNRILLTATIMMLALHLSPALGEDNAASLCNGADASQTSNGFPGCAHPEIGPNAFAQGLMGKNNTPSIVKEEIKLQPQPQVAMSVPPGNNGVRETNHTVADNNHPAPGPVLHADRGLAYETIDDIKALMPAIESVLPEVPTPVVMSPTDTNRLICPEGSEAKDAGETDVIVSKEKGVTVKIVGRNIFVKFLMRKSGDEVKESTTPTDLFVVCGDVVYNIIAIPKPSPSKTVRLVDGINKVKKNVQQYEGMSYEKKLIQIIKNVYKNELPDGFSVQVMNKHIAVFDGLDIVLARLVTVDGEGLRAKEFRINCIGKEPIEISEKDFLRGEFTTAAAAVIIDKMHLSKGDTARMIIVERSGANGQ